MHLLCFVSLYDPAPLSLTRLDVWCTSWKLKWQIGACPCTILFTKDLIKNWEYILSNISSKNCCQILRVAPRDRNIQIWLCNKLKRLCQKSFCIISIMKNLKMPKKTEARYFFKVIATTYFLSIHCWEEGCIGKKSPEVQEISQRWGFLTPRPERLPEGRGVQNLRLRGMYFPMHPDSRPFSQQ